MKCTALVLRFLSNMKLRVQKRYYGIKVEELEPSELEQAERLWITTLQIQVQEDRNFRQLGRIQNSSLKYETKFPALLLGNIS